MPDIKIDAEMIIRVDSTKETMFPMKYIFHTVDDNFDKVEWIGTVKENRDGTYYSVEGSKLPLHLMLDMLGIGDGDEADKAAVSEAAFDEAYHSQLVDPKGDGDFYSQTGANPSWVR